MHALMEDRYDADVAVLQLPPIDEVSFLPEQITAFMARSGERKSADAGVFREFSARRMVVGGNGRPLPGTARFSVAMPISMKHAEPETKGE